MRRSCGTSIRPSSSSGSPVARTAGFPARVSATAPMMPLGEPVHALDRTRTTSKVGVHHVEGSSVFLGIAVGGLLLTTVFVAESANSAKQDAESALAQVETTDGQSADADARRAPSPPATSTTAAPGGSCGGAPELLGRGAGQRRGACSRARALPADCLPPAQGDDVALDITLNDLTIEIAPGVKYSAWSLAGGRSGAGDPRARGPDREHHADERRHDPALGRLPCGPDRPERRVRRRRSRASR